MEYIEQNMDTLYQSDAFLEIGQSLLCEVLDREKLAIEEELTIWQMGLECSAENRRKMLGPALFKIRFPRISKEHFTEHIVPCGVLSNDELVSVLLFHDHPGGGVPSLYPLPFATHRLGYTLNGRVALHMDKLVDFNNEQQQQQHGDSREYFHQCEDTVHLRGLPWTIAADLHVRQCVPRKRLDLFLYCNVESAVQTWSCKCTVTRRIPSRTEGMADYVQEGVVGTIHSPDKGARFHHFMPFNFWWHRPNGDTYRAEDEALTVAFDLFKAHKCIMVNASDVFESMFRFDGENAKEKTSADCPPVIELPDVEAAAFKVLLSSIYAEDLSELNGQNAMAVLYAANKYNISLLVKAFSDFPINQLANVFLAFDQSRLLNQTALRWADAQCRQNGIGSSAENHRAVLGSALFQIRFPLIPKNAFDQNIASSDDDFLNRSNGTLFLVIDKLSDFAREKVGSERSNDGILYIKGLPWKILAKAMRNNDTNEKCMGIFLWCTAPKEDPNWSCKCSATFRIVSHLNKVWNRARKLPAYSNVSNQWGTIFIGFEELMESCNGMYDKKGDKVTLAIDITTEKGRTKRTRLSDAITNHALITN
ncbi:hypothetical protein niasHS_017101 [Heterodera schachtii]|uniref:BTB domain-containing protein n=1 Tax=Heterodera schachtii TaxID=97005 RepID=A0ABD2HZ13_HETSC